MRLERFDALSLAIEEPRIAAERRRKDVAYGPGPAVRLGDGRLRVGAEARHQEAGRKGQRRADEAGGDELRQVLPAHRPILPRAAMTGQGLPGARDCAQVVAGVTTRTGGESPC